MTSPDPDADASALGEHCDAIVDRIKPILAGESPGVQRAVVCDLVAIWLACNRVGPSSLGPGRGRAAGDRLREELLALHCRHVRELVEMYLGDVDG